MSAADDRSIPEHAHAPWEQQILEHLGPGAVIVGIGNRDKGDDGAGSIVAERLASRGVERALDCGGVPENYVSRIARLEPTDVILVDAVDFDKPPGSIGFFGGEQLSVQSASTHSGGLRPVVEFLGAACNASCWLLAVQPAGLGFGQGLSEPVRRAVETIVSSHVWTAHS